jgi:hypothetical protein
MRVMVGLGGLDEVYGQIRIKVGLDEGYGWVR